LKKKISKANVIMGYVKIAAEEMLKLSLKRDVRMRTVFIRLGTGTTVNMVTKFQDTS
jgi:hypothetical protein